MTEIKAPRVAISYSWTTPEYEEWVLNLATELCDNNIDIVLDKWDLREGDDANVFMEQMVADKDIDKVLILCDRKYAEKANNRSGGVGTETQIISAKIYSSVKQSKFVVVVSERDETGKAHLPTYYTSRIYIDLSNDENYTKNFEQLLRWIYDRPIYVKPELGKPPAFLTENRTISLGTDTVFRRAIDAVKNGKSYADGAVTEYFEVFAENLERFRISHEGKDLDDLIVENIKSFIPYRNQFIDLIITLSRYGNDDKISYQIHKLFENLIPYMYRSEDVRSWGKWDFDNYKFIIEELFLYTIAILLKNEKFNIVNFLLRSPYYSPIIKREKIDRNDFTIFHNYLESFVWRTENKSETKWFSLKAQTLLERCTGIPISFNDLQQADFTLYLIDCISTFNDDEIMYQEWWPETLIYTDHYNSEFEIYLKSKSKKYFERIKCIFDINSKEELNPIFEAFKTKALRCPQWRFNTVNPSYLSGFEKMSTKS